MLKTLTSKCCLFFVSHCILPPWDWNCIKCEGKLFIWLFYGRNRGPFNTVKGLFSTIIKIIFLILDLSFQKIHFATLMVWSSILIMSPTKTCYRLQKKHQQTELFIITVFLDLWHHIFHPPYFSILLTSQLKVCHEIWWNFRNFYLHMFYRPWYDK